ncbi:MAG: MFS transporter [Solirubrobacterales bacterium]|nr:MFS transporter [Solirubrobacterales bacterium]HMT03951.1 MFS transporter [Solirubrobacterales bacterium]
MTSTSQKVQRTYLILMLGNTLAASFIWGINTIFLLDAGLSNFEAFAANAFFTAGMVIFEIPTGVVADTIGRRVSYMAGTLTLMATTLLYVLLWETGGPFWAWALVSLLLGLGFTFFSGAVEAWLVDALDATGFTGELETIFGRGQIVAGTGMLTGSVLGGYIAQVTSLGVPFLLRAAVLVLMFFFAAKAMRDIGFEPRRGKDTLGEMKLITTNSIDYGWRVPPVKWIMLAAPFTAGVSFYAFYALQPYLLELVGDPTAYGIAGITAALVAGSQIIGGYLAPRIRRLFRLRTSALLLAVGAGAVTLALIGIIQEFWIVTGLIAVWAMLSTAAMPIRQSYINGMIPSRQRATILSFDSMLGSTGGVVIQPVLGRAADASGYATSYLYGAFVTVFALPFIVLSRRQRSPSDTVITEGPDDAEPSG